jgi:hypothetical protein
MRQCSCSRVRSRASLNGREQGNVIRTQGDASPATNIHDGFGPRLDRRKALGAAVGCGVAFSGLARPTVAAPSLRTDFPQIVGKNEGMALLGDDALAIINDEGFGITGGRTQIVVLRGTGIARR